MGLAIRHGDGLMSAAAAEFENEAELEQVLVDQIDLLRGPQDRRFALVARQVNLFEAGILDILCVDEDGLPVAVEVKLSGNSDRRKVVAQIVDYLSSLTTLTVDEVDDKLEGALEQALKSFDAVDDDAQDGFEPRWQAFGANLRSGSARIIVALDHAPADLKRIVQFLSDRSRLDIRLITVSKFTDARVGALYVSTVLVGREGEPVAPMADTPPISETEFLDLMKSAFGTELVQAWQTLAEGLKRADTPLHVGHFHSGAPYVYVPHVALGKVKLLRVSGKKPKAGNAPPLIRDSLHAGVWDSTATLREARDRFRQEFLRLVPFAKVGGEKGRVEAPIRSVTDKCDAVVRALAQLANELTAGAAVWPPRQTGLP